MSCTPNRFYAALDGKTPNELYLDLLAMQKSSGVTSVKLL